MSHLRPRGELGDVRIPSLSAIGQAILSLGEELKDAEAIGVMGSIARGDFHRRSDIDIFVVVKERKPGVDIDRLWWERINGVLSKFRRDATVITYSVEGLKRISNWYVLRLASEGVLIYDRGGIRKLFDKIIKTALDAGLVERTIGSHRVWSARNLKLGERFILEVRD